MAEELSGVCELLSVSVCVCLCLCVCVYVVHLFVCDIVMKINDTMILVEYSVHTTHMKS